MARSLSKLSIQDLLVKISAQDFLDYRYGHSAAARAIWQAQSAERARRREWSQNEHRGTPRAIWQSQINERVARAISKFASCHNETGLKRGEGCASDLKIRIDCVTTRAIWPGQSDERVARAISKFAPHHSGSFKRKCVHHEIRTLKMSKATIYIWVSGRFFDRGLQID